MPVTSTHKQYQERQDEWRRCRDAADGAKSIKAAGTQYLPRLTSQSDDEYEAYKKRAIWYGATGRTVQGLTGAIFRTEPSIKAPDDFTPIIDDITMTGVSLSGFLRSAGCELLKTGRYGILVDMGTSSQADRAYWVGYRAEQILNWGTMHQGGKSVLTMVVLEETHHEPDAADPFTMKCETQYRVLWLRDGQYEVELWRKSEGQSQEAWTVIETMVPTIRQQPLSYIPFCFVGPTSTTPDTEKPPMLDLVEVNLSHYRNSADHEHGMHYTALPTPWVAGFPTDTVLKIGSSIAWVSNDTNAKAGMLEFTGDGLGTLERGMDRKEALMAILGARLLEPPKRAVEAADTHRIRMSGEQAFLANVASSLERAARQAMTWHLAWHGLNPDNVTIGINKDFVESRMDPVELAELMKAWQGGAISHETLYWNMQQGELTRPDVDFEDEKLLIESQPPATIPLQDSNPLEPFS